jgi:hypothetical protein
MLTIKLMVQIPVPEEKVMYVYHGPVGVQKTMFKRYQWL